MTGATRVLFQLFAVLVFVGSVAASTGYTLPDNFTANEPTQVRINQRIDEDSELRDRFDSYRVYLAVDPPGWGREPICWLNYSVPLDERNVTVTIPADVVPDDYQIRLSTGLILRHNRARTNGFDYSGSAHLLGGTGTWIQRELDGWTISSQDDLSCAAFGCARRCHDRYYTGDATRISDGTGTQEANSCTEQCEEELSPRGEGVAGSVPFIGILLASFVAVLAHL